MDQTTSNTILNLKYGIAEIGTTLIINYTSKDTYTNASIYIIPPALNKLETSAISTTSSIVISGITNTSSSSYAWTSTNTASNTFSSIDNNIQTISLK